MAPVLWRLEGLYKDPLFDNFPLAGGAAGDF